MKLSIIIKIEYYREELKDCIENITTNNKKDFEIIIITNKNDKNLNKFVLNIIDEYGKYINIYHLEYSSDRLNEALNIAIENSNGKYIHILDQNSIVSEKLYFNFLLKLEEYDYDLFVFDFINISKDIEYIKAKEILNKYLNNKNTLRISNKESYADILNENDLRIDFSKLSKKDKIRKNIKLKGIEYKFCNLNENIQVFEEKYKKELLLISEIKEFNIIIKKEILLNKKYNFKFEFKFNNINSNIDILKTLPIIRSIAILEDSYIYNYIDSDSDIKQKYFDNEDKNAYINILNTYKSNKELCSYIELLEFNIFYDLFNSFSNEEKHLKEVYLFLKNRIPNLNSNSYYQSSNYKSKILRKQIKSIDRSLKSEYNKNEKERIKTEKQRLKKEKQKNKKDFNKFDIILRKLRIDLNRIKRTRLNTKYINYFKDKINKTILKLKENFQKIKSYIIKIFKKRDKKESLLLEEKGMLLLDTPMEINTTNENSIITEKNIKTKKEIERKTKTKTK